MLKPNIRAKYPVKGDACPSCGRGMYMTYLKQGNGPGPKCKEGYKVCRYDLCPNFHKEIKIIPKGIISGKVPKDFSSFNPLVPVERIANLIDLSKIDNETLINELMLVYNDWEGEGGSGELKDAFAEVLTDVKKEVLNRMKRITPTELYDALSKTYDNNVEWSSPEHYEKALKVIYVS